MGDGESLFWRKILTPILRNVVGRTLYDDMARMEAIVASSGLDWTVVRPAGLFDAAEPTDGYEVAARRLPGRAASRADLANILIREATEPRHLHAVIEVITRTGIPSPTAFLKEAFGIGGWSTTACGPNDRQQLRRAGSGRRDARRRS